MIINTVVYLYHQLYLRNNKELTTDTITTWMNLQRITFHEKILIPKGNTLCSFIYITFLKIAKVWKWRTDQQLPELEIGERERKMGEKQVAIQGQNERSLW